MKKITMRFSVAIFLIGLLLIGCADQRASARPEPSAPPVAPARQATATRAAPTVGPASQLEGLAVNIVAVAKGFRNPTHVTHAGDGSGRLFVVEQQGTIRVVRAGDVRAEPFLDISKLVGSSGSEQGLLSVAFHPRYSENGRFFVYYTARNGDNTLASYQVSAEPDRADPTSGTVLFAVPDPAANHNGGQLKFGPDGYLYIGMGDGGRGGDPWGNSQNLGVLLGKILRIDVDHGMPYAIPADNPFVGREGARPELWAYGLRNPWRFSFDRANDDLFIADVGQNLYEEINVQPAASAGGENYGWNTMEGAACYAADNCDKNGLTLPAAVYSHSEGGCSVTGGYVYRGSAQPQLNGIYLYADYCSGKIWGLRANGANWATAQLGELPIRASSFGEDEAGELYILDHSGGVLYRIGAGI